MLYTALVSASTPVALRYLYLTPHPPTSAVLASIQTAFAAAILCLLSGERLLAHAEHRSSKLACLACMHVVEAIMHDLTCGYVRRPAALAEQQ